MAEMRNFSVTINEYNISRTGRSGTLSPTEAISLVFGLWRYSSHYIYGWKRKEKYICDVIYKQY